jgi:tetraacyldisaccharide 4'-kinase
MERAFGMKEWNILLRIILYPLSLLYLIGGLIRKFFRKKFYPENIKIISVGSPFAGGTGKTLFAIFLTKELLKRGYNAFYLQKTYSFLGFKNDDEFLEAVEFLGKERVLRAKSVKKFLMEEDRKKVPAIFIIDDGFTNPHFHRHLNIAVFDSNILFGNRKLLPLGPMRVPLKKLKEADLIVFKGEKRYEFEGIKAISMQLIPQCIIELKTGKTYPPDLINGKDVVVLCGTGNPFSFINTITSLGANHRKVLIFPDHYRYSEKEIKKLSEKEMVITTIKDSKRLPPLPNFFALKVQPYLKNEDLELLMSLLSNLNF